MNNLKNMIVVVTLLSTTVFYGQRRPDRDKIKALKIAFITERLELKSSEAQAFWPVYNAYEEKMASIRDTEQSQIKGKFRNLGEMSNSEAEKLLDTYLDLEAKKSLEQRTFVTELKKIIPAKKIILLKKTEDDFKRKLIQLYRQNRNGNGGFR